MAIATETDVLHTETIVPIKHDYTTATLVDKDTSLNEVLPYINGYDWKVDYYNQVKAVDDMLSNLDTQAPASLQQYSKIKGMILKVQTPIDVSSVSDVSGEAIVVGGVVPVVQDMITVNLAGNRFALLRVNSVTVKHYSLSNIFDISYVLDSFIDVDPVNYNNLLTKVVKELYYDENYLETDSSPILLADRYNLKREVEKTLGSIGEYYVNELIDRESNLLLVPGQKFIDIDMQEFFLKLTSLKNTPALNLVNLVKGSNLTDVDNIYNQLLAQDKTYISLSKGFGYIDIFTPDHFSYTIGGVDSQVLLKMKYLGVSGIFRRDTSLNSTLTWTTSTDGTRYTNVLPNITTIGNNYLFTDNFYLLITNNVSLIESMLITYLEKEFLKEADVRRLLDTYRYWSKTEKYFYMPFMILLLKYAISHITNIIY